jgi:hypothetical protein
VHVFVVTDRIRAAIDDVNALHTAVLLTAPSDGGTRASGGARH